MNDDSNSGNRDGRKTRKPNARLLWHKANHREAWAGIVKMPPEEVGVYWRIILLQYVNRAAHAFAEDAEMAQACHCSLKEFRRIRKKLIERGRLEIDEETGIYWDKRAMTEMVEAGFLSDEQIQRANQRWAKEKAEPPKPRVVVDNVQPLNEEAAAKLAEVGLKSPSISSPSTPRSRTQTEQEQQLSSLKCHASRVQIPDITTTSAKSPPSAPAPAASLPLRGSGGGDRKKARQEALDALSRSSLAQPKGSDETVREPTRQPDPETPTPAADRTARRA